ncbi:MAG TPA: threonine--tRNA ligase, partial [Hyphomonadaceae bacterium]|nr:threonine--tRNA ligase [Hyphomonadaceae bacterium]
DYVLPDRLNAEYVGEDGAKHKPVMLHRAILGSLERFIGILIENCAGAFPMWLAPTHVVVATISEESNDYAEEVAEEFRKAGLRVETDMRNEKINYKIREHSHQKIPYIAVVGRKEAEERKVALRQFGTKNQELLSLDEALVRLPAEATPPDLRE